MDTIEWKLVNLLSLVWLTMVSVTELKKEEKFMHLFIWPYFIFFKF
jgi:hypothetical protein